MPSVWHHVFLSGFRSTAIKRIASCRHRYKHSFVPFAIRGFDSDNGGEFLNNRLLKYFLNRKQPVQFTRSRPYHSNDNAHIEEKNWTKVRQYLGYGRFDDSAILPLMNDLYTQEWALLHNFFLPSVKLLDKRREGGHIVKIHDDPKTPCQRLLEYPKTPKKIKQHLKDQRDALDPFSLQQELKRKILIILNCASFGA